MADMFPTFRRWGPVRCLAIISLLVMLAVAVHYTLAALSTEPAAPRPSLAELAAAGNADAQYHFGFMHMSGLFEKHPDYAVTREWLQRAADQNHAAALGVLGWIYEHGKGVKPDINRAAGYYILAAKNGDTYGAVQLAHLYRTGAGVPQDHDKAFALYESAAAKNNGEAMLGIARMYHHGDGRPANYEAARTWSERAMETNSAYAGHAAANYYEHGVGAALDLMKAGDYYRHSANRGFEKAIQRLNLATALCRTAPVMSIYQPYEERIARECLLATATGEPGVLYRASQIYAQGFPALKISSDPERARALRERAAATGYDINNPR